MQPMPNLMHFLKLLFKRIERYLIFLSFSVLSVYPFKYFSINPAILEQGFKDSFIVVYLL